MTTEEEAGEHEGDLERWAAARAGDDPRLIEALRQLVISYRTLEELGEDAVIREFTTLLGLADGVRQEHILDAALRAASRLPGGEIYKRLRALEGQTGLKFHALDRRRRQLQKEDDERR